MGNLKVGIIVGSTRPGRRGRAVAEWVLEHCRSRPGAEYELIDLLDQPLPHLDEPRPAAMQQYEHPHTRSWSATIAGCDGFIFVTPEYNHSIPGVLKNAIDYLLAEWGNKAAGLVGYGTVGGARAVEHLRCVLAEVQVADVRQSLAFTLDADFEGWADFKPRAVHERTVGVLLDQVEAWAGALKPLRT